MKGNADSVKTVEAVERACGVIRALKELNGAGVTELSKHLEMSKSGTHKQLATLVNEGYVVKEHSEYRLGFKFLSDGEYVKSNSLFYNIGRPQIDDLADTCKDHVYLAAMEQEQVYCIYTAEGDNSVATNISVGKQISSHSSAAGKAILSQLSSDKRQEMMRHDLPEKTESTVTNQSELKEELESIRERGIAFEDEENVHGMRGIGSPIVSPEDDILGAVAISGPVSLLTSERFKEELPELVRQTKNFIEVKYSLQSRDLQQEGSHIPEGFY